MPNPNESLWLIPLLPFLGALGCVLLGGTKFKNKAHLAALFGSVGACIFAILALVNLPSDTARSILETESYTWFQVGPVNATIGLEVDPITAVMLFVITFIGSWIVVFSIGYMHDSPGYPRFFAVVSLFLASMCLLVLGDSFLSLVAGWEGVGLCSYLLVGYWYHKPSASAAARKAFLVTRLGDALMLLGIFLFWQMGQTLEFTSLFRAAEQMQAANPAKFNLACFLLFCGAVGKSAQFPLYVWLPDAMEGPTPVSALIHAATMVTAGVYLLARCSPLFALAPDVQLLVAILGGITAILAAFIALTQNDLKRVLAYSTVSQLGYMFMALGCSGVVSPKLAVTAALFHLFTHAFFKAVLFLGSGSVMHAMGDVIDMRKFSGLRKVMPITHITFLAGSAALAGFPLLSGFWSKDMILESLLEASESEAHGSWYGFLFFLALLTAFMTAFYTFRAYFKTFWGELKLPPEAHVHAPGAAVHDHSTHGHDKHDAHATESAFGVMTFPLLVLGIGAILAGFLVGPFGLFEEFVTKSATLELAESVVKSEHHEAHFNFLLALASVAVSLGGIGLAWSMYGRKSDASDRIADRFAVGYYLSLNKLYVDELYNSLFVKPATALAYASKGFETVVAEFVRLVAAIPAGLAGLLKPLQNGLLQFYSLSMAMGVAAFLFYLIVWSGR
jgi:NADH-quinone oxidoreductase subunit L